MAIFYCSIKIVSRGKGKSAVGAVLQTLNQNALVALSADCEDNGFSFCSMKSS